MYWENKILVGKSGDEPVCISPKMANRHGMIAGATGTGKTVTLKVLAESFSDCGVPVFLADVKGDLAGMCCPGVSNENVDKRVTGMGLAQLGFDFKAYPTCFWDVYGKGGLPLRTTISEMGPLLLGRILGLNDTQADILTVIFRIADDEGLLLIDSKDLRSMLQYVGENAKEYTLKYGNISKQSLGAVLRSVMALEAEGGDLFFGEPALNIGDWLCTDNSGRVGDPEKPKMIFFFDEAHLLFDDASKVLLSKIEQVVKLIRSKGVGIYFVTQNPSDIPGGVLSQLGNKVQHALHAYTPAEQKGAKAAAQSFRENPEFDTYETLLELGTGEALVSVLDEDGVPTVVKRCTILPPQSQMGALDDAVRDTQIKGSLLYTRYMEAQDRDSAYEFLQRKSLADAEAEQQAAEEAQRQKEEAEAEKQRQKEEAAAEKQRLKEEAAEEKQRQKELEAEEKRRQRELEAEEKKRQKELEAQQKALEKAAEKRDRQMKSEVKKVASSAIGTLGRELGNQVGNSVAGSFGKRLGGNVGASLGRGILSTLFKL